MLASGGEILRPLRLTHELIANQRAGNQSRPAPDQSADRCMAESAPDDRPVPAPKLTPMRSLCSRVVIGDEQPAKPKTSNASIALTKIFLVITGLSASRMFGLGGFAHTGDLSD